MKDAVAILDSLLAERWSCRGYRTDPVPRAVIEEILSAAAHAPSWCNTQPWHLHLLDGDAADGLRRTLFSEAVKRVQSKERETPDFPFPPKYEGVYQDRRRASGWQLYDALGVQKGDREASGREMLRNFEFFDAPHVAVLTTTASLGVYGLVDCGTFLQSFLLSAHARGLGTVAQAAPAGYADVIRRELELDDDRLVVCAVSFGYPDQEHPSNSYRTARQGLDELVTWAR